MPSTTNRLARMFAPLPHAAPLAQWRLLETAFQPLRHPPVAIYAALAGGVAAFGLSGQLWCLAWVACGLITVPLGKRVAAAFEHRTAEPDAAPWGRHFARFVWGQSVVLGAGGIGAAFSHDLAVALLVGAPLSFVAAQSSASAVLAGPARGQAVLLMAPLAAAALLAGTPVFWALAWLAALQCAMAVALADHSAAREKTAAEAQAALTPPPLASQAVLPKAVADFQKLLGRDQVTGLPNRYSFLHLLGQESTRAFRAETALSLLLVSWDDYDSTAAASRPDALAQRTAGIARRLRATLHRQQDILASLGCGRFAVVLPFTDAFGAKTVAENLQAALRGPILDADGNDDATATGISIGAATYCGKGLLPETQLLQYAEEALAAARKTGGDKISRYDPMVSTLRPPAYAGMAPKETLPPAPAAAPAQAQVASAATAATAAAK